MPIDPAAGSIVHAIQLAIAPVFLLTGLAGLLGVMTTRLARVIDFDALTLDPQTGELKAEYQPNSTTGGPGDKLHPNRAGYAAMGNGIDLVMILGK